MAQTAVKLCKCDSKDQDKRFGKQKRLMNRCKPTEVKASWRCTVCETVRD